MFNKEFKMKGGRRARALFLVLATYVFLQLAWWVNLLISSAAKLFEARTAFNPSPDVLAAALQNWEKTVLMVAAEGVIFSLLFMFGLSWIWRVMRADNYILARERNFLLAVTHELKTPIASIRLAIDTLKRLDLDGADRDEMLDVARSGTLRLERRVEDILQATRLNLPDALVRSPFDITEFVEDTASTFLHLNPESSVSVKMIGDSGLLLQGDEEMWRLCLINLLENAIKYSPSHTSVEVVLDTTTKKPRLSIIDHGPGISPDERKKVFEAFYRLPRDKDFEGTGLGLHLVFRIVKMHGAEIHITSTAGGGATFVIDWPAN
ncbi:MAG: HAMP domain-containing sensor histidine kinase [Bacteroidetes bacterium]|nr:HAMP domain-containing sensor histidine kinase [Bacteroidota bacterium]